MSAFGGEADMAIALRSCCWGRIDAQIARVHWTQFWTQTPQDAVLVADLLPPTISERVTDRAC
jgi:hypothetical protein